MENDVLFIVGLPRTGSTLLRSLLNRSDRISICAETHFLQQWSRFGRKKQIKRFGDLKKDRNVDAFLDAIYAKQDATERNFRVWLSRNIDRDAFRERLIASDRSDRAILEIYMQMYAERKKGRITPDLILGEKTPSHIYYVPTLFEWFPQAKVIHTLRDPRAIFVSAVKLVKAGKWGWKDKLRPVPPSLMDLAVEVSMAMYILRAWLAASRLHTLYAKRYPGKYYLIRFEDFLVNPETYLRGVCDYLRVPFQPGMLDEVAVIESSFNTQRIVKDGIDKKVADRWKEHIHPLTRTLFTTVGRKQLESFGYE